MTRSQSAKSTPSGWSTYTQNRAGERSSTASTSTPGSVDSTVGVIAAVSSRSLSYVPVAIEIVLLQNKWAHPAPISPSR